MQALIEVIDGLLNTAAFYLVLSALVVILFVVLNRGSIPKQNRGASSSDEPDPDDPP